MFQRTRITRERVPCSRCRCRRVAHVCLQFASIMSISPVQRDDAARLIRIIREQHGYDDADAHSTPSPAVIGLRGKLERALERLSSDLYNKKTHFLLEFIQNADDNTYADDVTPSLKLRIEDSLVVFECNELGFSADNIKAICDIGASTKMHEKSTRRFIGEKGIGFKSVFTVANEMHLSSGPYSFHFDRTAQLCTITPVWGSAYLLHPAGPRSTCTLCHPRTECTWHPTQRPQSEAPLPALTPLPYRHYPWCRKAWRVGDIPLRWAWG
ncbi:hypothetical protein V8E53_006030 [Lactarius tabidus]